MITDFVEDTPAHWIACYFAVLHSEKDYIKEKVLHHCVGKYIISRETCETHKRTNGQHFHVVAEMSDTSYHKLCKNMKDKYKLNGRANNGEPKQYGKVNTIKDINRMLAYSIKDGDYETNLEPEKIEELKKISFVKETKEMNQRKETKKGKTWIETVCSELIEKYPDKMWDMRLEVDFNLVRDKMFDNLGKSSKAFDEFVFDRLFLGVVNKLPKTDRCRIEFRERLSEKSRSRFVLY